MQIRHVVDLRPPPMAGFAVFSPLRFEAYAKDLERAFNDMRRDYDFIKPGPMMVDVPPALPKLNGSDELVPSLTGASSLAGLLKIKIERAKAKFVASGEKVDAAFAKLDNAGAEFERAATKIDAEAESALSQIRQLSNE